MTKTLDQVIAGLPAEARARIEARTRQIIQQELADGQELSWPPTPPVSATEEYYVIDQGSMENLLRVKTALYNSGHKRLTGDQIRDLANMMEANLGKAVGLSWQQLKVVSSEQK